LGNFGYVSELDDVLKEAARTNPAFVRILANDCLSSLPPLTFFRDAVIDESGEGSATFHLEKTTGTFSFGTHAAPRTRIHLS
jgi:signal-transduction protein with cAMP-binding, CBS, and nucleotidyltransferase domain